MLEPEERQRLRSGLSTIQKTWIAFFLAPIVYAIISHIVSNVASEMAAFEDHLGIMAGVLAAMSVIHFFTVRRMRKRILAEREHQGSHRSIATLLRAAEVYDSNSAVRRYFDATIISSALFEAVGIYGFIIYILSGSFAALYGFIIPAMIAMLMVRPRYDELERLAIDMRNSTPET